MNNPREHFSNSLVTDTDRKDTYAGVGRVLSEWEGIEVGLCRIFSFLKDDPDGASMKEYGQPRIFRERYSTLLRMADQFFVSFPDQLLEGTLHQLSSQIFRHSDRRNEVAHGIVMPINAYSFARKILPKLEPRTNYYALLPSYYQVRSHNSAGLPEFIYGASSLHAIADEMALFYPLISDFRESLRTALWQKERR
jgi:hypothetical protein